MSRPALAGIAAVALCLGVAGCGSAPDRAGGDAGEQVRTLTFAQGNRGGPHDAYVLWADEVSRLSDGHLTIEFRNVWSDDPRLERSMVQQVRDGEVDLAGVGARVFDRLGYAGFQPLLAPFLVDSYELQAAAFDAGIPDEMLAGVSQSQVGVVGTAILPGVLNRIASATQPATGPESLVGKSVATVDSALADASMKAVGAIPHAFAFSTDIQGFDLLTAQPAAVSGNGYQGQLRHLTGNVALWPRPLVVVMDPQVAASLDDDEREVLAVAAGHIRPATIQAARDDDTTAMKALCGAGVSVDFATADDLRALGDAVGPVYDELRADPQAQQWLTRLDTLKVERAAQTDVLACPGDSPPVADSGTGIPDGTYRRSFTRDELRMLPGYQEWWPAGAMTLTIRDGVMTKVGADGGSETHSFTLFKGRIRAESPGPVDFIATYHVDDDLLWFSDFVWPDCDDCLPDEAAYGSPSKPWVRVR